MSGYRPRLIDASIASSLGTFGAVVVEGPRAVGKTTSALHHAASSVRLDASPGHVALAGAAPEQLLAGPTPRLIDEWQLAPVIWNAVRHEVDVRGEVGQFLLTGSAAPADDITRHSGAGRFRRVTLRPMTLAESGDSTETVSFEAFFDAKQTPVFGLDGPTVEHYARLIHRGGWPALVEQPQRDPGEYLGAYLDDISRIDLPSTDTIVDPTRMSALLRALGRNIATEIPVSKLAREAELGDVGVSTQTVRRYLDALTRVHVLEEQPAWKPHLRSAIRLRVSPKWHFIDPSLAAAAQQISAEQLLDDPNTLGFYFESLVIRDLRVYGGPLGGHVTHYRDEQGLEADAIVELRNGNWAAFEVKLGGEKQIEAAAKNLKKLAERVSEARRDQLRSLNIVTAGRLSYTRPDGVNVIALGHLTMGAEQGESSGVREG